VADVLAGAQWDKCSLHMARRGHDWFAFEAAVYSAERRLQTIIWFQTD